MAKDKDKQIDDEFKDLRRQAERVIRRLISDQDVGRLSAKDARKLVQELQVHQIELEIQNEELRRAQRALQESRDKYADLYDFAPVGYFTLDRHGVILEANLSGARLVGVERRGLIKRPFIALVAAESHATFYSHLSRVFEIGQQQTCELKLAKHEHGEVFVRMEGVAIQGEKDEVARCRTTLSDISEVKRVQHEVTRTQEQVLANMAEGVCVIEGNDLISFTNHAFDAIFGCDRGEFLGKALSDGSDCLEVESAKLLPEIIREAESRGYWRSDLRCHKKNGMPFDARVRIMPLELFGNKRLITIWEDMTALKEGERNLRDSEQRFRAIFESATDAIFLKDHSLRYTQVNPAFAKLFERSADIITGLTYEDLFGKEGMAHMQDVDLRVLSGQTIEEEQIRRIDGVPLVFHEVRSPLYDGLGHIVGIFGIARDITGRQIAEIGPGSEPEQPRSDAMQKTLALALRAAERKSIVLLQGESGSGKDWLARFIHDHSEHASGPYFAINCASVSHELAESELFGHERGSFTGAHARKRGLLELAEGGTLLLNEIGELSLALQAKLLAFLDTRKFTRVGGEKEIAINARLIAATNRDLEKEVETGRFRKDLFYRLNVMVIRVPPLRERLDDLPLLVREITSALAAELQLHPAPEIDAETIRSFRQHAWPGNIRELRNVIERSLILGERPGLDAARRVQPLGESEDLLPITVAFGRGSTLREMTDEVTRCVCVEALRRSHGNKKQAAQRLGIARDSFYRYLRQFNVDTAGARSEEE